MYRNQLLALVCYTGYAGVRVVDRDLHCKQNTTERLRVQGYKVRVQLDHDSTIRHSTPTETRSRFLRDYVPNPVPLCTR